MASVAAKVTVSAWLYHPFASAPRGGVALVCGAVASYLNPNDPEPVYPALSRQLPATDVDALSGPAWVLAASHVARPEIASLPVKLTPSEWLYQPFTSAARAGEAVTCGAVASYLRPNWLEELRLPARSPQDPLTEAAALSGPA